MGSTIARLKKILLIESPLVRYLSGIIAVNVVLAILVTIFRNNIPPVVPLFYGRATGGEQLVPQSFLFVPLAIAILVALINGVLIHFIKDEFIQQVLVGISFAATLLATITVIKIIMLVGSF